jgi:hypothetical protein
MFLKTKSHAAKPSQKFNDSTLAAGNVFDAVLEVRESIFKVNAPALKIRTTFFQ